MTRIRLLKWLVFGCSFLLVGESQSQGNNNQPLRLFLDQLEQQFSVRFSYMDQTIDSIQIKLPADELNLEQALDMLKGQLALDFIRVDEKFISIRVRKSPGKVCGYLLDEEDLEPVSQALVFNQSASTISDDDGYFELPYTAIPSGIQISHVSYQDQSLYFENQSEECPRFFLKPSIHRLEEVIIKNYITRGIDKRAHGEIVVDVPNTKILPGLTEPDVFFTLQNLPGIQSISETVTDINIRGGSNDQNLILWDGIRLYQTGHFFGLISAINPHIIDQTTLIKNGTPAELGEAVSGTIQVETKDNTAREIKAHLGSNFINSDLLLDLPTEKLHVLIASRQSIGGTLRTPTFTQYFDRAFRLSDVINDTSAQVINSDETFRFYDFSINAKYKPSPKAKINSGVLIINNGISYQESGLVNSQVESKVSNLDQETKAGYLSYEQHWSSRFKTKLYSSIMNYKQESVNFDVLTGQEHILENEVQETAMQAEGKYYVSASWDFKAGVQFRETGIRNFRNINIPSFLSLSKEVFRTSSFYVESNNQINLSTTLAAGLRANYFNLLNSYRFEPRLALTTRLTDAFSLELLAETKSQTTVQVVDFQTDFLGVENRKWQLVNRGDIPLLTSNQVSLGLNYQKDSWLISLEGFLKEVEGVVTSSQGFLNQFQFERTSGEYAARGIELLINPTFGKLDSWITYSYLNSDYTFPGLVPPEFRNNFDITHALSMGVTYKLNNLELSSGLSYRSGVPFTKALGVNTNSDQILFDYPNALTLKNYLRVDFSAKYGFVLSDKWSGSCGISIWNLTNRENTINALTRTTTEGEVFQINQTALGITPNISVRLSYNF